METSAASCHSWCKSEPQELQGIGWNKIYCSAVQVSPHASTPVQIATAELRFIIQVCFYSPFIGPLLSILLSIKKVVFLYFYLVHSCNMSSNSYSTADAVVSHNAYFLYHYDLFSISLVLSIYCNYLIRLSVFILMIWSPIFCMFKVINFQLHSLCWIFSLVKVY